MFAFFSYPQYETSPAFTWIRWRQAVKRLDALRPRHTITCSSIGWGRSSPPSLLLIYIATCHHHLSHMLLTASRVNNKWMTSRRRCEKERVNIFPTSVKGFKLEKLYYFRQLKLFPSCHSRATTDRRQFFKVLLVLFFNIIKNNSYLSWLIDEWRTHTL